VLQDVRKYPRIEVKAIGVGDPQDPQEVDQPTLGQISNAFLFCTDAEQLKKAFAGPPAPPVSQGLRATVTSPWPDRAWLAARTVHFRASLTLPTGKPLESEDVSWSAPAVGTPLFEGRCDTAEESALIEGGKVTATAGWVSTLRPVIVFIGFTIALLMLWFWVPRLVWRDRYGQAFQPQRDARWTPPTVAIPGPVPVAKRPAPPGFEHGPEDVRAPQRAPADATRVFPINKMGTRTRLELKRAVDDDRR
jgi:Ca-activated chloride channel family protein